jgi:hypothetical protein
MSRSGVTWNCGAPPFVGARRKRLLSEWRSYFASRRCFAAPARRNAYSCTFCLSQRRYDESAENLWPNRMQRQLEHHDDAKIPAGVSCSIWIIVRVGGDDVRRYELID